MCPSNIPSPWHAFLQALPKAEHHLHLEGCLTPELIFHLAEKNNIPLPSPNENPAYASIDTLSHRYGHFTSLDDFLSFYFTGMSVLIHASDFEDLAWSYFTKAHEDGVVHAEVFFDPQVHLDRGVSFEDVVTGFSAGCRRAEAELGMSTRLIMCFLKHLSLDSAKDLYAKALESGFLNAEDLSKGAIHGLGCSSSEVGPPKDLFRDIYADAKAKGIPLTAHAGEEGDASYIAAALEMGATRIDHGRRLVEDPELMKRVADEGIMLTACPVSNVQLKCVKDIKEVPIRVFLDAGVKFSINSDDPAYFGAYVLECYCRVQEAFGLSVEEWRRIVENGIRGSWMSEERRGELLARFEACVREYQPILEGACGGLCRG